MIAGFTVSYESNDHFRMSVSTDLAKNLIQIGKITAAKRGATFGNPRLSYDKEKHKLICDFEGGEDGFVGKKIRDRLNEILGELNG